MGILVGANEKCLRILGDVLWSWNLRSYDGLEYDFGYSIYHQLQDVVYKLYEFIISIYCNNRIFSDSHGHSLSTNRAMVGSSLNIKCRALVVAGGDVCDLFLFKIMNDDFLSYGHYSGSMDH